MIKVPSHWVLGVVVAVGLTAINGMLTRAKGAVQWSDMTVWVAETVVTFFTGWWYAVRHHYTQERAAPEPGAISLLFTLVIAVCGLTCFLVAGSKYWFAFVAAVLLLSTQKDLEIICCQLKTVSSANRRSATKVWKAKLLALHHWYSVVRDLSMCFWWLVYGAMFTLLAVSRDKAIVLFAPPYLILVTAWCVIKWRTHNVESSLAVEK